MRGRVSQGGMSSLLGSAAGDRGGSGGAWVSFLGYYYFCATGVARAASNQLVQVQKRG